MKFHVFIIAATLASSAIASQAHEVTKGPNGGKVADVAGHHIEFTHTPGEVTIFATDEADKPIATAGSKGRVIIQSGGKTVQAPLTPAEPNRLVGKLEAPLTKGAVVVVSTTFSDGHAAQARFTVD